MGETPMVKLKRFLNTCFEQKMKIGFYLVSCLLSEIFTFVGTLVGSILFAHWVGRVVRLIADYQLGNIGQAYVVVYTVGIISAQATKSSHSWWIPSCIRNFEKRNTVPFASLRLFLVIVILFGCTGFLYSTYTIKYAITPPSYSRTAKYQHERELDENEHYHNDVKFLVAMSLLAFTCARILETYKQYNWIKVRREYFRRPVPPGWFIYLFYFCSLVLVELAIATVFSLGLIAIAIVIQYAFSRDWFTYILCCVVGACAGHIEGAAEDRYFPLHHHYSKFEPYFTTIHWDARQNALVFTLLPFFSRWYFESQFAGDSGPLLNFSFFVGCAAANCLYVVKCQTLFSIVFRETESTPRNPRVHPVVDGHDVHQHRRRTIRGEAGGFGAGVKTLITSVFVGYYPIDRPFIPNPGDRPGSTSTGTCSTLIARINNNNGADPCPNLPATTGQQHPETVPTPTPTCPRSVSREIAQANRLNANVNIVTFPDDPVVNPKTKNYSSEPVIPKASSISSCEEQGITLKATTSRVATVESNSQNNENPPYTVRRCSPNTLLVQPQQDQLGTKANNSKSSEDKI